jgi:hypothetical protein
MIVGVRYSGMLMLSRHDDTSERHVASRTRKKLEMTTSTTKIEATRYDPSLDSPKEYVAPYVPTCATAQTKILELLALTKHDVLFDLGCGDARLLLEAVQQTPGLRAIGIEIRQLFVDRAIAAVMAATATETNNHTMARSRIDIRLGDMTVPSSYNTAPPENEKNAATSSVSMIGELCKGLKLNNDATVVYLFLTPKALDQIHHVLKDLVQYRVTLHRKPLRIVAYMFRLKEWEPVLVERITKANCPVYLYRFDPANDYPNDT